MTNKKLRIGGLTFLRDEQRCEDVMNVYTACITVEQRPNIAIEFTLLDICNEEKDGMHYWEMQAKIGNKGNISVTKFNGERTDIPSVEVHQKNYIPKQELTEMVVAFLVSAYLITQRELEELRGKAQ